jgi:hypothetical protein
MYAFRVVPSQPNLHGMAYGGSHDLRLGWISITTIASKFYVSSAQSRNCNKENPCIVLWHVCDALYRSCACVYAHAWLAPIQFIGNCVLYQPAMTWFGCHNFYCYHIYFVLVTIISYVYICLMVIYLVVLENSILFSFLQHLVSPFTFFIWVWPIHNWLFSINWCHY